MSDDSVRVFTVSRTQLREGLFYVACLTLGIALGILFALADTSGQGGAL